MRQISEELWQEHLNLVRALKDIEGAYDFSGECSCQTIIPLKDGRNLRIGITDPDVSENEGIWFDYYGNVKIK